MNTISSGIVEILSIPSQFIPSGKELDTSTFDQYLETAKVNGKPELDRLPVHKWSELSCIFNGYEYLRLTTIAAFRALHNDINIRYRGVHEADKLASQVEAIAKNCFQNATTVSLNTLKADFKTRLLTTPFFANAQKNGSNDIQGLYLRTFSKRVIAEGLRLGLCSLPGLYFMRDDLLATAMTTGLIYYGWISTLVPDAHQEIKKSSMAKSQIIPLSERHQSEIVLKAKEIMDLDNEEDPALVKFKTELAQLNLSVSFESPFPEPISAHLTPNNTPVNKAVSPANKAVSPAKDWEKEMEAALDKRDKETEKSKDWYKWDAKANLYATKYYKEEINKLDPKDPQNDGAILGYKIEWENTEADRLESRVLSMEESERNKYIGSKIRELKDRAKSDKSLKITIKTTIERLSDLTVEVKKAKKKSAQNPQPVVVKLDRRRGTPSQPAPATPTSMSLSDSEASDQSEAEDSDS